MVVKNAFILLLNLLKSKRLALITILLLTGASVAGMLFPQGQVFRSWWFISIAMIFVVNLAVCTISQVVTAYKRDRNLKAWGITVFHIGMVLVVLGGFVSTGFKTSGYMMLAEGETRKEHRSYYYSVDEGIFFTPEMYSDYDITLLKQNPVYDEEGRVYYISSELELRENGETLARYWVEKGSPLAYKNYRFFHYIGGFAPLVVVSDQTDDTVARTFMLLNTYQEKDGEATYSVENQSLPGTDYLIDLEFFPDAVVEEGQIHNVSDMLRNPKVQVRVYNLNSELVGEGIASSEEGITLQDGNTVALGTEIRRWVGLEIVNDPGADILFAGTWISLAGLLMFFVAGIKLKSKEV